MIKKILIVDDEQDIGELVMRCLSKTGLYEVTFTSLPEEVEQLCLDFKPDLVIMDLVMPHVQGTDLITILHKNYDLKDTRIIVTSGLGEMTYHVKKDEWKWEPNRPIVRERGPMEKEHSAARMAEKLGVDDFISKPFTAQTLVSVVEEVLAREGAKEKEEDEPSE